MVDFNPRMKFSQPCTTQVQLKVLVQTVPQTLASMCTGPALLILINAGALDPSGLALFFSIPHHLPSSSLLSACLYTLLLFSGTLQLE